MLISQRDNVWQDLKIVLPHVLGQRPDRTVLTHHLGPGCRVACVIQVPRQTFPKQHQTLSFLAALLNTLHARPLVQQPLQRLHAAPRLLLRYFESLDRRVHVKPLLILLRQPMKVDLSILPRTRRLQRRPSRPRCGPRGRLHRPRPRDERTSRAPSRSNAFKPC